MKSSHETTARPVGADPTPPESTRALTWTWLALLTFSLANYYVAEEALAGALLAPLLFAAVFVKLTLVTSVFMEIRHHGRAWLLPVLGVFGVLLVILVLAW